MELIKDIVKQFYPLLVLMLSVSFVVWIFFSNGLAGKQNIFQATGNVYESMLDEEKKINDGLNYMPAEDNAIAPTIEYTQGAQEVGTQVIFKDMFTVTMADGSTKAASEEDGFAIYLRDIKSKDGNSVLQNLTTDAIEKLEEIPAAFVYDKELDTLYFYGSGVYIVELKIYGSSGVVEYYEFKLPVETM